jgi:lipopolysaccharide export LptBFGC system permease protein LptF
VAVVAVAVAVVAVVVAAAVVAAVAPLAQDHQNNALSNRFQGDGLPHDRNG